MILTLTTVPIYPSGPHVSHPDSSEWGARPEQPTDRFKSEPSPARTPLRRESKGGCRVIKPLNRTNPCETRDVT